MNREILMTCINGVKKVLGLCAVMLTAGALSAALVLIIPGDVSAQDERETGAVSGTIADRVTNTPLYGASVTVLGTGRGDMADDTGAYIITAVPPGTYNIRFSMIGYQTLVKTSVVVSPGRSTELAVQLETQAVELEAVTVRASESYFERDPEAEVSGRTIDNREIMDAAGGTMDIQRVIQVLPSVISGTDQLNEIIVRGGNYGENLFVMDGIEIPNPNHFANQGTGGGPISLLRADFINDASFIAGAFPARYGDKASSVLDISLRRGNREKTLTNLDMGMAGLGFMAEGPLGSRGSFLVSARKSYLDLIISSFGMTAVPHYYNLQSKLTWDLGGRHTLMWNSVYGDDSVVIEPGENVDDEEEENVDAASRLFITGLTLKSALTSSLISEVVLSHVRNEWKTNVWEEKFSRSFPTYVNRSVEGETTLKGDFTWLLGKHDFSAGFSLKNSAFDHDIFVRADSVYIYDTAFETAREDTITDKFKTYPSWHDDTTVNALKSAGYAQFRLYPTGRVSLRIGGRYDYFDYNRDGRWSPRIGVRYRLTDTLWLNGGYGVHYQNPAYIELTAHANNRNLIQYHTRQLVIGTEWIPLPHTRMSLEGYTKRYSDVPVSKSMTTPDPWDSSEGEEVSKGKGHSEGVEFYLHRKMSTTYTYIVSCSLYRAWFEDPRSGEERPWDFDHRLVFTASAAKRWHPGGKGWYENMRNTFWYKALAWILPFGDEVLFSAKWRYTGGRPYTSPTYERQYHAWIVPGNTSYNTERFPAYHRLDLRIDRRFFFRNWSLAVYFDIMNVYQRENIWDYSRDEYGKVKNIYQFSTMPIGGFSVDF